MNRLLSSEDCQKASMYCQDALEILEELKIEEDQEELAKWLEKYNKLYELLTNQPPGLPALPRSTCAAAIYPFLNVFWKKYNQLKFPNKYNHLGLEEDAEENDLGLEE